MRRTALPGLTFGFVLAACHDPSTAPSAPVRSVARQADAATSDASAPVPSTLDDVWARVAREDVPGFAGIYVDSTDDDVTLALADTNGTPAKIARVEAHLGPHHRDGGRTKVKRVKHVQYDFAQLQRWRYAIVGGLKDEGLRGLDIDERANRVALGVRRGGDRGRIRQELQRLGIPMNAVTFFEDEGVGGPGMTVCDPSVSCDPPDPAPTDPTPPTTYRSIPVSWIAGVSGVAATLRDRFDAPVGGEEWGFVNASGDNRNFCSIGVPANFNVGASARGYVTASHCAVSMGNPDGAIMYQPRLGLELARKTWDPPYSAAYYMGPYPADATNPGPPCFSGYRCRVSDAAFYALTATDRTFRRGYAAATNLNLPDFDQAIALVTNQFGIPFQRTQTFLNSPAGTLGPFYTWDWSGVSGMPVYHVGRTTGTRNGTVVKTCYDVLWAARGIAWACQFTVKSNAQTFFDNGDSGGPVYTNHAGAYWLAGLVSYYRGSASSEEDAWVYTPWSNIDLELYKQFRVDGRTALQVTTP